MKQRMNPRLQGGNDISYEDGSVARRYEDGSTMKVRGATKSLQNPQEFQANTNIKVGTRPTLRRALPMRRKLRPILKSDFKKMPTIPEK